MLHSAWYIYVSTTKQCARFGDDRENDNVDRVIDDGSGDSSGYGNCDGDDGSNFCWRFDCVDVLNIPV